MSILTQVFEDHITLDYSKTLIFDRNSKTLFTWNEFTEELKPIKYKTAFQKYKKDLNSSGEKFFNYHYDRDVEDKRKLLLSRVLAYISISASTILLVSGLFWSLNPDSETSIPIRALVFFASTLPTCLVLSVED